MTSEPDNASTWPSAMIPPDDPKRQFTIADPDGPRARHVSVSGGTYTILVTGGDSAGRYCLIDMLVPPGSGPPPHRHDFEEMFTLLEGELEFTVRGQKSIIHAGSTVNVPANTPRFYKNISGGAARMLCARRRDRKNSSWLLVIRLMLAPRRHLTSPSRSGSSEGGRLESSGQIQDGIPEIASTRAGGASRSINSRCLSPPMLVARADRIESILLQCVSPHMADCVAKTCTSWSDRFSYVL